MGFLTSLVVFPLDKMEQLLLWKSNSMYLESTAIGQAQEMEKSEKGLGVGVVFSVEPLE
jgi:hypothetical protein